MSEMQHYCEHRMACAIAQSDPARDAYMFIADAVTSCSGYHSAVVRDGKLEIVYCNEFGPTCAVDDVFERMNIAGWKNVCVEVLKRMLRNADAYREAGRTRPKAWPEVILTPEDDTPVINKVKLSMWIPRKDREALERAEAKGANNVRG